MSSWNHLGLGVSAATDQGFSPYKNKKNAPGRPRL